MRLTFFDMSFSVENTNKNRNFEKFDKEGIQPKFKMSASEADLKSYNLQMQQVDAALTSDPNNPELLKLKEDLQEVISLTQDLLEETRSVAAAAAAPVPEPQEEVVKKKARPHDHIKPIKHWQVGEQCQAIWAKDGK